MQATSTTQFSLAAAARSTSTAWDLLVAVTARDLKVRYQRTLFSYAWWVARPLTLGLVLYFALGRVLELDIRGSDVYIPNYGVFLLAGLFPWFWFSGSLQQASSSVVSNGGLLKKVRFPLLILPLSAVFYNTVQFFLTLPILTAFVIFAGIEPDAAWVVGIPILLALQFLLVVGLGTFLASLNVFFRDLGPLLDVVLLLMFYTSAVIFPLSRVPESIRPILQLNPMVPLLEGWRKLFLAGSVPGGDLWLAVAVTGVFLVGGLFLFRGLEKYFADAL